MKSNYATAGIHRDPHLEKIIAFYTQEKYDQCLNLIGDAIGNFFKTQEQGFSSDNPPFPDTLFILKIGETIGKMHSNGFIHGTLLLENFTADGKIKNFGQSRLLGQSETNTLPETKNEEEAEAYGRLFQEMTVNKVLLDERHISELANDLLPLMFQLNYAEWQIFFTDSYKSAMPEHLGGQVLYRTALLAKATPIGKLDWEIENRIPITIKALSRLLGEKGDQLSPILEKELTILSSGKFSAAIIPKFIHFLFKTNLAFPQLFNSALQGIITNLLTLRNQNKWQEVLDITSVFNKTVKSTLSSFQFDLLEYFRQDALAETAKESDEKVAHILNAAQLLLNQQKTELALQAFSYLYSTISLQANASTTGAAIYLLLKTSYELYQSTGEDKYIKLARALHITSQMPQPYYDYINTYLNYFHSLLEADKSTKKQLLSSSLTLTRKYTELSALYKPIINDLYTLIHTTKSENTPSISLFLSEAIKCFQTRNYLKAITILSDYLKNIRKNPLITDPISKYTAISYLSVSITSAFDYYLDKVDQFIKTLFWIANEFDSDLKLQAIIGYEKKAQASATGNLGWALARYTPYIELGIEFIEYSLQNTSKADEPSSYSARASNLGMSFASLAKTQNESAKKKELLNKALYLLNDITALDESQSTSENPYFFELSKSVYLDYYNQGLIYFDLAKLTYDFTLISYKTPESAQYFSQALRLFEKAKILAQEQGKLGLVHTLNNLIAKIHLQLVEIMLYEKHWAGTDLQKAVYEWFGIVMGGHFNTRQFIIKSTFTALKAASNAIIEGFTHNPTLALEAVETILRIWTLLKHHRKAYSAVDYLDILYAITDTFEQASYSDFVRRYPAHYEVVVSHLNMFRAFLQLETTYNLFSATYNNLTAIKSSFLKALETAPPVMVKLVEQQLRWISLEKEEGVMVNGIHLKNEDDYLILRLPSQNQKIQIGGIQVNTFTFNIRPDNWLIDSSLETFAQMESSMALDYLPPYIVTACGSLQTDSMQFSIETFRMPSKVWDGWNSYLYFSHPHEITLSVPFIGKYHIGKKRLDTDLVAKISDHQEILIFGAYGITVEVYLPFYSKQEEWVQVIADHKDKVVLSVNSSSIVLTIKTTPKISSGNLLLLIKDNLSLAPMASAASFELLRREAAFPKPTFHSFYPLYFFSKEISAPLIDEVKSKNTLLTFIAGIPDNIHSLIKLLEKSYSPNGEIYLFVDTTDLEKVRQGLNQFKSTFLRNAGSGYLLKSITSTPVVLAGFTFRPFHNLHIVICDERQIATAAQMILDISSIKYTRAENIPFVNDRKEISFLNFKGNTIGNLLWYTLLDDEILFDKLVTKYNELSEKGTGKSVMQSPEAEERIINLSIPKIPKRSVVLTSEDQIENITLIPFIRQQESLILIDSDTILSVIEELRPNKIYASNALEEKLKTLTGYPIEFLPPTASGKAIQFNALMKTEHEEFITHIGSTHPHLVPSLPILKSLIPEEYLVVSINAAFEVPWNYLAANYAAALKVPFYLLQPNDKYTETMTEVNRLLANGTENSSLQIQEDCIVYRNEPNRIINLFNEASYKDIASLKPKYLGIITSKNDIPIELDSKPALCLQYNIGRLMGPDLFTTSKLITEAALNEDRDHPMFIKALLADASTVIKEEILEEARKEIYALERFFKSKSEITLKCVRSQEQPKDIEAFLSELDNAQIIHFAGHGVFDLSNLSNSGLCFNEGILTIYGFQKKLSQTPLVFINACDSGIVTNGINGFAGLSATLISNGAMNYIGSMWPIFDDASFRISVIFYEHILRGVSVGSALRMARSAVVDGADDTWAAYVLFGCPRNRFYPDTKISSSDD